MSGRGCDRERTMTSEDAEDDDECYEARSYRLCQSQFGTVIGTVPKRADSFILMVAHQYCAKIGASTDGFSSIQYLLFFLNAIDFTTLLLDSKQCR
jgi:hypothetical protein